MMLGNGLAALQGEPTAVRVGQVTVVTWPGQRSLGIELARRAGRAHRVARSRARRTPGPLQLIVVPDGSHLDSLSSGRAPAWGAGIALPGARTILLRADRDDLYGTLRHELAHLALHQAVKVRVPLWFDEGYASWAAGEWDRLGVLDLNLAVVRGAVPDLRALDGALRGSASTADAAYALAVSAVTELARRNPSGSLTPLLQRLEAGEDFDAAVLATTGLTMSQFDTAVAPHHPPALQPRDLAPGRVVDGEYWPFRCGRWCGFAGEPISPVVPPSTRDGRFPPKRRTRLNLTEPRNRSSLNLYVQSTPSAPQRPFCARAAKPHHPCGGGGGADRWVT